jgi:hypothetical protein
MVTFGSERARRVGTVMVDLAMEFNFRCYMAVLTTLGQVSIYAPRSDPLSQRWDEVSLCWSHMRQLIIR